MSISQPELHVRKNVETLYDSLKHGDDETASKLLAIDLEWCFMDLQIVNI
ncbi:hypothetical protein MKW94_004161 [Papaver nudicaule]|uniref:Uncharacterized protein n=1 Tax=Papaver nudicaule TaxID=74823 RepID=A0AA41VDQ4_PAPNU|nr:hypothetical protein [Papaver nudicaule]